MNRQQWSAALAALILASPAAASGPAQKDADTAKAEKKICRSETATGSIMKKRTCRTAAEWAALNSQAQNDLDRVRQQDTSRQTVQQSR